MSQSKRKPMILAAYLSGAESSIAGCIHKDSLSDAPIKVDRGREERKAITSVIEGVARNFYGDKLWHHAHRYRLSNGYFVSDYTMIALGQY